MVGIPMPGGSASSGAGASGSAGGNTGGSGGHPGPPGQPGSPGGQNSGKPCDTDVQDEKIRARQIVEGKIVAQWLERGLPPSDEKLKSEYVGAIQEAQVSEDSVRERESVPREERDLVREYSNKIAGTE
jgi:hypothetical protein